MAIVFTPILLLHALIMAPTWIHDYELADFTDRVLSHPLPPGADFGEYEAQGVVTPGAGLKDLCGYRVRFDLDTYLSAEEVLKYYEAAKIGALLEINVWTLSQPAEPEYGDRSRMIVEIQDNGHDGGGWDLRCW
ncbi:hypothetical protein [Herbidospora sp. NBRC 101105]|uniref:hypothetical protein n=1 Tax=Herbidospora sp. NBRC 101105 TaxID=3032195 RepID=UPI0024A3D945|nr:hypothetical protein [Herbidospora sp. NBRC 101105]GLX96567.1 hypothetical protein Hesp01_45170 [Herbidospora sp. NBRC 101105]